MARRKMLEKKGPQQRTERKEEKGKAGAAGVRTDAAEGAAATTKVCPIGFLSLCVSRPAYMRHDKWGFERL